jgi:hypothetical protein
MEGVDLSRRRVWFGRWLPGVRMIEIASGADLEPLFRTERYLVESYQGPAWKGLLCASLCLHFLTSEPPETRGPVLADAGGFLNLRYRARGLEAPPADELVEDLAEGDVPTEVVPGRPDLVINYLLTVFAALSAGEPLPDDRFSTGMVTLRNLAEETGRLLAQDHFGAEDWPDIAPLWDAVAFWKPDGAAHARAA